MCKIKDKALDKKYGKSLIEGGELCDLVHAPVETDESKYEEMELNKNPEPKIEQQEYLPPVNFTKQELDDIGCKQCHQAREII